MLSAALRRADEWRAQHQDHIWRLMSESSREVVPVQPSDQDLFHPHLWKDIHWAWYFDHRD